jgi:hypothetical protein
MKIKNLILIGLIVPNILWADRFSKDGEIVYDSKTKLSWQSKPNSKQFNWNSAKSYCSNLTYGGKSDWRLPNIDELKSLVDYNKYDPAIATNLKQIIGIGHLQRLLVTRLVLGLSVSVMVMTFGVSVQVRLMFCVSGSREYFCILKIVGQKYLVKLIE